MRIAGPVVALLTLAAGVSHAQTDPPAEPPSSTPQPASQPTPQPAPQPSTAPVEKTPAPRAREGAALRRRVVALETKNRKLEEDNEELKDDLELLKEDLKFTDGQVKSLLPLKAKLSGYLDFGFFSVTGDGSGIRPDIGHVFFPEYRGTVADTWVFMGDPLSTTINSRGDPAETSESRAITFDGIDNQGVSSFVVNALNLQFYSGVGDSLSLQTSVDFLPRGRNTSDPEGLFLGDYIDVKLAYMTWRTPVESFSLNIYAGKFESVVGREYRRFEANDMITATPSLLCRYLCGRPLGVKARLGFLESKLTITAAITNGSHFYESFNFGDEVDSNQAPTGAARVAYRLPIGTASEIGVSGAFGAQDQQMQNDVYQWHAGADLFLDIGDLELTGEYIQGDARGRDEMGTDAPCAAAPCLSYKAAYGLASYRWTNLLIPYFRTDWRDALHQAGASFVYISKLLRFTAGARAEVGTHLIFKAEYTVNRELGRIPQFPNNILATSMILKY